MKKKHIIYLLAFLIPTIIFFVISQIIGYYPLGDSILRNHDAYVQYPGFYLALKDFSLFSFKGALGFNFFTTMAYYIMSPFSLLIFFFNQSTYDAFYLILILIKIGLIGLTMNILLQSENKKAKFDTLVFSTSYALCGYVVAYYYNTMWLDSLYMLPLVILSINKLIKGEQRYLYVITLSITIILHYYIGYMICIFSLIYFIFKIINTKNINKKKVIVDFIILSLLSGLIASFVLIPSLYSLLLGKANKFGESYTNYWALNKNAFSIPYDFTIGSFFANDQKDYGPAQIYSTIFCAVMFLLTFVNSKFTKKYKISVLVVFLIFVLSFTFNLFDYSWQFFQRPIWFNHRYSFLLSFFVIYIGYITFKNIKYIKLNNKEKMIILFLLILNVLMSFFFRVILSNLTVDIGKYFYLIISIILIFNYLFLFDKKKCIYLIILFVGVEISLNTYNNLKINSGLKMIHSDEVYDEEKTENGKVINTNYEFNAQQVFNTNRALEYINNLDRTFYRVESTSRIFSNDGLIFDYNGIRSFNSLYNKRFFTFLVDYLEDEAGNSKNNLVFDDIDPYVASLFNIKYFMNEKLGYAKELKTYYPDFTISENKYPLSIGFMVNNKILDTKLENNSKEENISNIFNDMVNMNEKLYINYKKFEHNTLELRTENNTDTYVELNFMPNVDGYISYKRYINSMCLNNGSFAFNCIKVNDENKSVSNTEYLSVNKGDKVTLILKNHDIKQAESELFLINKNVYENIMNDLSENLLLLNEKSNHLLEGTINVTDDKNVLFLSLVYEKGFTIKVDGKEVEPIILLDTFVGIEIDSGEHTVTIDYFTPYLKIGLIMSVVSALGCVIYLKKTNSKI